MTTLELARMVQNQRVSWNFLQPLKPFPYQVKGSCHEIKKTKCPWILLCGYRVFKKLVKSLLSYISSSKQHQQTKLIHCNTPNLKFNKISAEKKIADDIDVANFTIFSNSEGKGKLEVVRVLPLSQEEEEPRQEQDPHLDIPWEIWHMSLRVSLDLKFVFDVYLDHSWRLKSYRLHSGINNTLQDSLEDSREIIIQTH